MSAFENLSTVRAEMVTIGAGELTSTEVDIAVSFGVDGRATARVTWWGDAPKRSRLRVRSYHIESGMPFHPPDSSDDA